jgi:aryl hydrocarbon receptor nuclear translocator
MLQLFLQLDSDMSVSYGQYVVGMWTWQGSGQPSDSGPGSSGSAAHAGGSGGTVAAGGAASGQGSGGPPQQQELSDMLQMLDQGGATSFEDLNMFNTSFE